MAYAYRDKYGILHAVEGKEEAKQYAAGKIVAYEGEHSGGYPVIGGQKIFDYGFGKVYVGGNEKSGKPLDECDTSIQMLVKHELEKIKI